MMTQSIRTPVFVAALAALALAGCGKKSSDSGSAGPAPAPAPAPKPAPPPAPVGPDPAQIAALFKPLPANFDDATAPATAEQIALGKQLYFDTRLSKNQDVSCNTCHGLDTYGVDGLPVSKGHKGQVGARNSPTVYNAAGHFAQFWDGRAATIEEQAKGPMLNPVEMALADDAHVVAVVKSIPGYVDAFGKAFPGTADAITFDNAAKAIGAFERKLATPAPFDKYLAGDAAALGPDATKGLALFVSSGCTACHTGPLLGGSMYMKTGLTAPYADTTDLGRFGVTKVETDKFMFKVPSLRNIAKTAPYFHDGKIADLPTAVKEMGRLQLAKSFTDDEVKLIVAFLDALTGDLPTDLITKPELPKSGPKTPKPDPS
ncbi:MAG: c-type cytochrome [Myxococcales bacterium]|nr:c-type cytochrome [Myxococcales bacterium]